MVITFLQIVTHVTSTEPQSGVNMATRFQACVGESVGTVAEGRTVAERPE